MSVEKKKLSLLKAAPIYALNIVTNVAMKSVLVCECGFAVRIRTSRFGVLKLHIIEKVYFDYSICYIYDLKTLYQCSIQTKQKLEKGEGSEW